MREENRSELLDEARGLGITGLALLDENGIADKISEKKKENGGKTMKKKSGARPGKEAKRAAVKHLAEKIKNGGETAKGQTCCVCGKQIKNEQTRTIPATAKDPVEKVYHLNSCGPLTAAWKKWREGNGEKMIVESTEKKNTNGKADKKPKTEKKMKIVADRWMPANVGSEIFAGILNVKNSNGDQEMMNKYLKSVEAKHLPAIKSSLLKSYHIVLNFIRAK